MAELVDALDSKSSELARVGSSPTFGTTIHLQKTQEGYFIALFFYLFKWLLFAKILAERLIINKVVVK